MPAILFMTLPEYGQATVILATAFELYKRRIPGMHIHVASCREGLRGRRLYITGDCTIEYHGIDMYSQEEAMMRFMDSSSFAGVVGHPPIQRCKAATTKLGVIVSPWDPEEYLTAMNEFKALITKLEADVLVLDPVISPAIDACEMLGRHYVVIHPMLATATCTQNQPGGRSLWYYPSIGADFAFPMRSWWTILQNIFLTLHLAYTVLTHPRFRAVQRARTAAGCIGPFPAMLGSKVRDNMLCLTGGVPEIDLPFEAPANLRLCGPICLPAPSLAEADPELLAWLGQAETVVMVLGSHIDYYESQARRVLEGLLGGAGQDRQVLWKVKEVEQLKGVFDEMLRGEKNPGRVRIVKWLDAAPARVVEHENVVCYVHHGGANSYLECARSGTPQVILPQWYDCYNTASTAEYVGLGVYGNKSCAPDIDAVELSLAIRAVVDKAEGQENSYQRKAREVAAVCVAAGGRARAADILLEQLEGAKVEKGMGH
ncbi:hypothetical protein BD626DRAFT_508407 [Schizophyllum amplum]|uniref:Erythromycin biosynthesis protein CIII-like C-terminal domain-containing protein n=1 Tax=Schizophyllum amplum TaxID=97359 RepID=A0A550C3U7_9AGAR|nr:hypothetical protein BD626DRAFT_508407 [Auriculariopsis ampla]